MTKGHDMRSDRTEAVIPELERSLAAGAAGQTRGSRFSTMRRAASTRGARAAAIGATCLAFGGTAMAATGVWDPGIGAHAPDTPPPTISASPVSAAMAEALGVFSRAPNAQDRGHEVEATLSTLGSQFADGVRPDSVRYLEGNAHGEATVLLSAERSVFTSGNGVELFGSGEPACVVAPGGGLETAPFCFGLDKILAGKATFAVERVDRLTGEAWGLVPDGVATVTARFDGEAREVPVTDNYFRYTWGNRDAKPINGEGPSVMRTSSFPDMIWRDAEGDVVPQQGADQ
jgi:hypothetical protein